MKSNNTQQSILVIASSLYKKGYDISHIDVANGIMGQVLFFFTAGRALRDAVMISYAEAILEDVCVSIHNKGTLNFLVELCDAGCALNYLVEEKYVIGNINEILSEFDEFLYGHSLKRLKKTLLSDDLHIILEYCRMRVKSNLGNGVWSDSSFISEMQGVMKEEIRNKDGNQEASDFLSRIALRLKKNGRPHLWQRGLILLQDNLTTLTTSSNTYEQKKSQNKGKSILIVFSHECRGTQYGVGTYINQLKACYPFPEWEVYFVNLYRIGAQIRRQRIKKNLWFIDIPFRKWQREAQYKCSVFHYLSNIIGNAKNIVCHFNFVSDINIVRKFKKFNNAKIVFTLHYTAWSFSLEGNKKKLLEDVLGKRDKEYRDIYKEFEHEKMFMLECDRIIAISDHTRRNLETLYKIPASRISTIYNAIQLRNDSNIKGTNIENLRQKYGISRNTKIFIFIGRLDAIKGIGQLIESYLAAKEETSTPSKLIVVGDGDFQKYLNLAKESWSDIVFTGFVDKETIHALLRISDYGIIPSVFEEFGYVALEMLSEGLPIIANNTSGLSEIVTNVGGGCLYQGKELTNVILRALENQLYIPTLNIEKFKKLYSYESFSYSMYEFINSL